jgi:ABC-type bacteriocin/lantibiotic exporter with double-glycine peptidase domain
MTRKLFVSGAGATIIALLAALGGALRPILLTALLTEQHWTSLLFGTGGVYGLGTLPTILAILTLELAEGTALIALGLVLSRLASEIGRLWRGRLAQAMLHAMAIDSGVLLTRYVALTKTYVEVIEQFFRQYLIQSIAALVQLLVSLALALRVSSTVATLLFTEIIFLLILTTMYSRVHARLANRRLAADERILSNTSLNPRLGLTIWFGGLGSLWLRQRLKEIKVLSYARRNLSIGEATYANATTMGIGLFVVLGFAVITYFGYEKVDFITFLLYAGLMMGPVVRISSLIPELREYALANQGLADAIRKAPSRSAEANDAFLLFEGTDARNGDLRQPINVKIGPGDRIAITGSSGSGKTSAIEALLGAKEGILHNPTVSGRASRNVGLSLPYRGIRYLTEMPAFEEGSVLFNCQTESSTCKNIIARFGLFPELDEAAIDRFLMRPLSRFGEPLSLGERQRVQLVRAAAVIPQVVFLDEALSGIDEDLERDVVQKLIENREISILVYIGHRRSILELFKARIHFS